MMGEENAKPRKRERGLDRAVEIIEALRHARKPMRPNELASAISAPRSTIHTMVQTLLELGLLEPADEEGRLYLGRKLYLWGVAHAEANPAFSLAEAALDQITKETHELAQFCGLDENKYVVLRQRESARPFRISADTGLLVPIPQTASGRLLVSDMSDGEIMAFIPPEDFCLPDGTPIAPESFIAEARQARAEGVFTFDSLVDSFTHCFAVPVENAQGRVAATLCIVAPIEDAARNRQSYIDCLKRAALPLQGRI